MQDFCIPLIRVEYTALDSHLPQSILQGMLKILIGRGVFSNQAGRTVHSTSMRVSVKSRISVSNYQAQVFAPTHGYHSQIIRAEVDNLVELSVPLRVSVRYRTETCRDSGVIEQKQ